MWCQIYRVKLQKLRTGTYIQARFDLKKHSQNTQDSGKGFVRNKFRILNACKKKKSPRAWGNIRDIIKTEVGKNIPQISKKKR